MVRILTSDRSTITLIENKRVGLSLEVSPNWYNTLYSTFTNIRILRVEKKLTEQEVKFFLLTHPESHIYTVIGNEPILTLIDEQEISCGEITKSQIADKQRIKDIDGDDYIDEFGLHVYITSRIGTSADIDLRYGENPDPELFTLQLIEHDIPNRRIY